MRVLCVCERGARTTGGSEAGRYYSTRSAARPPTPGRRGIPVTEERDARVRCCSAGSIGRDQACDRGSRPGGDARIVRRHGLRAPQSRGAACRGDAPGSGRNAGETRARHRHRPVAGGRVGAAGGRGRPAGRFGRAVRAEAGRRARGRFAGDPRPPAAGSTADSGVGARSGRRERASFCCVGVGLVVALIRIGLPVGRISLGLPAASVGRPPGAGGIGSRAVASEPAFGAVGRTFSHGLTCGTPATAPACSLRSRRGSPTSKCTSTRSTRSTSIPSPTATPGRTCSPPSALRSTRPNGLDDPRLDRVRLCDQLRRAHGRPRQLGRHHVPDLPRHGRGAGGQTPLQRPRPRARVDGRLPNRLQGSRETRRRDHPDGDPGGLGGGGRLRRSARTTWKRS